MFAVKISSSLCLFKHFQWLSWILLFCQSLGFVVLSSSETLFAFPGLLLSYMCRVQPLDKCLFFFFFFFSTESFYWMTWTFSLRLCLWHHLWCSYSWNCSTTVTVLVFTVPSGKKVACVSVPVIAGTWVFVSVDVRTWSCVVCSCFVVSLGQEAAVSLALDYLEKHHRHLPTPKAHPVCWFFIKTFWSHAVFSIEEKLYRDRPE